MTLPIIYQDKNDAIETITNWKELYQERSEQPAAQRLANVLDEFEIFALEYLGHFRKNIREGVPQEWLDEQVSTALDDYWAPLARIAEQYQVPHYANFFFDEETEETIRTYLDDLGRILKKFNDRSLPNLEVLLYFNKFTRINHYPFTNTAFVGLPYRLVTSKDVKRIPAIPHELGHYLFWNMGPLVSEENGATPFTDNQEVFKTAVRTALEDWLENDDSAAAEKLRAREQEVRDSLIIILMNWLEEIFADVIGARLGKENYLHSTTRLVKTQAREAGQLTRDDGQHPILGLRPYIVCYTLQRFTDTPLETTWNEFERQFGDLSIDEQEFSLPLHITPDADAADKSENEGFLALLQEGPLPNTSLTVRELRAALDPVLDTINQQIDGNGSEEKGGLQVREKANEAGTAFSRLLALARKRLEEHVNRAKREAQRQRKIYEILLKPVFLEGGYIDHSHKAYAWHSTKLVSHQVERHVHFS